MCKIILNRIEEILFEKGLTDYDLAKKCGLTKTAIYYIKTGQRIPNQISICKISHSLGYPAHEVFHLNNDNPVVQEWLLHNRNGNNKKNK